MTEPRPAATVLIGRENNGVLEVLLLRRNRKLAFAAGLWVFPGGKIDPAELEGREELLAAKHAAVRETKEETDLDITLDDLQFYHHWTTPVREPRRYATYFFFAPVTSQQEVLIDDGEIKDYRWVQPQVAIEQFRRAELAMMPPTLMSLQILSSCTSVSEVAQLLAKRPPLYILPVLRAQGEKLVCLYEGDAGYATGDIDQNGARHRLIIDFQGGDFEFVYSNCEFPSVNGELDL